MPPLDLERDRVRTPWGWLSGFAWFLLAWPLLSLLAIDQLDLSDWRSLLPATLGPAAVGLCLLGVERLLDRVLGARMARAGQVPPSILRDLSNVGLCLAILLAVNVGLVVAFEDDGLGRLASAGAGRVAVIILAASLGAALVLRGLHRWRHGPARRVDLGEGWDAAPNVLRLFGYLALIPTLFVCTVMIDYTLRSRPDFGVAAWVGLPIVLFVGLRSAMARSPRYWARSPWEAWLREQSLAWPWALLALVLAIATALLFVLAPFLMPDDEITKVGRILVGVLLGPIGLLVIFVALRWLWRGLPMLTRRLRVAGRLARDPTAIARWQAGESFRPLGWNEPGVAVWLRDGRAAVFVNGEHDEPLARWLEENAASARVVS